MVFIYPYAYTFEIITEKYGPNCEAQGDRLNNLLTSASLSIFWNTSLHGSSLYYVFLFHMNVHRFPAENLEHYVWTCRYRCISLQSLVGRNANAAVLVLSSVTFVQYDKVQLHLLAKCPAPSLASSSAICQLHQVLANLVYLNMKARNSLVIRHSDVAVIC